MSDPITFTLPDSLQTTGGYSVPLLAGIALGFAVMVTRWDINRRTRKQLAGLEDHILHDIGIERDAALTEARRPFWK